MTLGYYVSHITCVTPLPRCGSRHQPGSVGAAFFRHPSAGGSPEGARGEPEKLGAAVWPRARAGAACARLPGALPVPPLGSGLCCEACQGLTPKPHAPFDGMGPTSPNLKRQPGAGSAPWAPRAAPDPARAAAAGLGRAGAGSGASPGPSRSRAGRAGGAPPAVQKCSSLSSCPGAAACTDARWERASSINSRRPACSTTTPSRAPARRAAASPVAGE